MWRRSTPDDANVYNVFKKTGTRVMKWNAPDMSLENMREALPGVSDSELPRVKMLRSPTQDSGNFFDFTSGNVVDLLKNSLQREIGWGLVGGLLDFGELIQPNTLFRGNNLTGYEMHNFFPYWYAKSYYTAMAETLGNNEFVFISRSASAGTQQYTAFSPAISRRIWRGSASSFPPAFLPAPAALPCGAATWQVMPAPQRIQYLPAAYSLPRSSP